MLENHLSQQRMQTALSADVPKIYVNGFGITATLGDIMVLLETNGRPVGILNMSYTAATTLAERLTALIRAFEERTGRPMLTFDAVAEMLGREPEQGPVRTDLPSSARAPAKRERRKPRSNGQPQHAPAAR